jgi:hypothetical protein
MQVLDRMEDNDARRQSDYNLWIERGDPFKQIGCVRTTAKRRAKSEAELLDHATNNLARALKRDMLKKDGRIDYDKLRKEGYSERLLAKLEQVWFHSFFRSRINSDTLMSSSGAALRASFKASLYVKPEDIARTIRIVGQLRALAIWMSAARSVYRRIDSSLISRNLATVGLAL